MAGLDRKVPNKPEDYKASGALKSCIYRSFITSFGVASHRGSGTVHHTSSRPLFFLGEKSVLFLAV